MIGGGYKKKDAHGLPTPSVSIGRSRPLQTYRDVEFGQGIRTYRQDSTPRSEQSIFPDTRGSQRDEQSIFPDARGFQTSEQSIFPDTRSSRRNEHLRILPDTQGSRRSERIDRQDNTRESRIKDGGMAILAGAGAAIATAATVLGLSSYQGGEDIDGGYVDNCGDGTDGSGVYGGGGGSNSCGNGSQL
ncbi:hypothetical protein E5676_scaffold21G00990 [Cucumis melo var. makuwa]|nr:hypothetical protein E6C27_scaffold468G001370 [Cucumis melo var. makuwa]TYK16319.1 hypothetical protein E5676_scaffold21G00990 [Cucumis melo var. makuwa]